MTTTATTASDVAEATATPAESTTEAQVDPAKPISADINERFNKVITELNGDILERQDVIHGLCVARVAQLHVLFIGPGGTGKSYLTRSLTQHISDSTYFECAFDETTDPGQVFGPPDIKAMVEQGKNRRQYEGMLPEATDAFLDEFFNGNTPLLHSIMPVLNERLFHNNGHPMDTPLRQAVMGTNKLNADTDLAALWDRVHIRYSVESLKSRDSRQHMIEAAVARMARAGRGVAVGTGEEITKVTVAELDQAHAEALALDFPEDAFATFLDLHEELKGSGVEFSDRRLNDGALAVLANAWVRGHEAVTVGDLDILQSMWWTTLDQQAEASKIILGAANPGEQKAMELQDEIAEVVAEFEKIGDPERKKREAVSVIAQVDKLTREADAVRKAAVAASASTRRVDEVLGRAAKFKRDVAINIFGMSPSDLGA